MGHLFTLVDLFDTNAHSVTFCGKLVLIAWYVVEKRTKSKTEISLGYFKKKIKKKR